VPTIKINNVPSSYQKQGKGPVIVLIHGLGSSSLDWTPQIEELSHNYTVVIPDLYGHGKSTTLPEPLTVSDFADQVAAILDQEALGAAHIVGLSLGGAVAFQLALQRPELVASLTITNSRASFRPSGWREKMAVFNRSLISRLLGMKGFSRVLAKKWFPNSEQLQKLFQTRFVKNNPKNYRLCMQALFNWSVEHSLQSITCPVLIVVSEYDYYPLEDTKTYMEKINNAQLVVIEGAHHAVTLENPTAFNQALRDHLEQQLSAEFSSAMGASV